MRDNNFETRASFRESRGDFDVRRICRYLPVLVGLLATIQIAGAQSLIDINMGFGAAEDSAAGNGIEGDYTFNNAVNFEGTCTPGAAGDATCVKTSALRNFMFGIGANLMLWEHFGVGMEASFSGKPTYAAIPAETGVVGGIQESQQALSFLDRTTFYDFNGIYQPVNHSRMTLQLIGGFGGANIKFYANQSASGSVLGSSSSSSSYLSSANHVNVHGGVGLQLYITDHLFLRPQFDIHYVPNLIQFGHPYVTQEMVWIGYTIGDRK